MTLETGQALAHYRIDRKLGEGGPPPLAGAISRELRRGLAEAQPKPRL